MGGSSHTIFKGLLLKKPLSKKIVKNFLFHGKLLLNHCLGLCTSQKTTFYVFLCLRTGKCLKVGANSVFHLSQSLNFCPHPGGGRPEQEVGGKAAVSTKLGENPFTAKTWPFMRRLSAS
jgi:hypothetical protein